jgi:hypothetical protein
MQEQERGGGTADISPNADQTENGDPPECRKSRAEVLFVSDTEMFRRIGISEKIGRIAVRELEKRLVFPPKDPLFGNKRYWPAVKGFLDARCGVTAVPTTAIHTSIDPGGMSKG